MTLPKPFIKSNTWMLRTSERRTMLIVGDLLVTLLALYLALYLWGSSTRFPSFSWDFIQVRVPVWFFLLPVLWMILMVELHDVHRAASWSITVRNVASAVLIGLGLYLVLFFYYSDPPKNLLPRRGVAGFFAAVSLLTLAWRLFYIKVFTAPRFMRRVLLVGGGKAGEALLVIIKEMWPPPFFMVGVVDDDPQKLNQSIAGFTVLGNSDDLQRLVQEQQISDIIVAISGELRNQMFKSLLTVQEAGVEIVRFPRAYEDLLNRVPIRLLEADWILRAFVDAARPNGIYELAKRLVDILGAVVGIMFLLICMPFIAVAILFDDGLPIFYTQTRAGRGAQLYEILKLRTMRRDAEADGKPQWAKEDDDRATRTGRFLRKTHLDELPQFFNVLRGEMSLVGPRAERPELMELFEKHVPFYRARLLVKPGITGWAQVNFGYASTIDETVVKLEYDLYYIKNRNLMLDLMILLRTPSTIFGFRGR